MILMVCVAVIRLIGYREWTENMGSDREYIIQDVQARLHREVSNFYSLKGGFAHPLRYDLMVGIGGLEVEDYKELLKILTNTSPVPASIGLACDSSPLKAQRYASRNAFKAKPWSIVGVNNEHGDVVAAHIDVVDSSRDVYETSAYDSYLKIIKLYSKIAYIVEKLGGLTFYQGGDNIIAFISNPHDAEGILTVNSVKLRIGVGIAESSRKAIALASQALDKLRKEQYEGVLIFENRGLKQD
jgi:GTP cyclohydrolase IIa